MKLAENIKTQINELMKQIDLKVCLDFYQNDSLYQRYKKHEKIMKNNKISERSLKELPEFQKDVLDIFDRFRLALTSGSIYIYMNSL